jgi:hypothetical protein
MTVPGPILFARYAFPPNALGYCGPADAQALLEYVDAGHSDRGLVALARQFDGAWPYLSLIAAATGRGDPLDPAVVEAYWIGNALLERVTPAHLIAQLDERFARRLGPGWTDLATLAASGARPHHNFHVFGVYPWVGMLRGATPDAPLHILDSCRIAWGRVEAIDGSQATVRSHGLVWTGRELALGPALPRIATVEAPGGRSLAPRVRVGDRVSLHWDWVCDVLRPHQVRALRQYTQSHLDLVNHALNRPVAAAVLD